MMGDYGFWVYSAMTQAAAALFGVIGMFIIFKLQSIKDKIKDEGKGILDALCRIGLTYSALERKTLKEIEEILANQIKNKERAESVPDDEANRLMINKTEEKHKADFLKSRENALKAAQNEYFNLVKNGRETMKGLSFIFGFSVVLLILKPLLDKSGSMLLLTVLYIIFLIIISRDIWCLMRETLS